MGVYYFFTDTDLERYFFMVAITHAAAQRILDILKAPEYHQDQESRLRIAVEGGGCSGFQYTFLIDDAVLADDHVFTKSGAEVVIDATSLSFMDNATLDYQDDLSASMFLITNPKATAGCGCGNSFSL